MRRWMTLVWIVWVLVVAQPVWAWNELGHMLVARIAYERLSDGERMAVVAMLRQHPHVHEVLLRGRPPHVSEAEWIFLRAATWPDDVRPPHHHAQGPVDSHSIYRFHHSTWHYVNFAYRPGQMDANLPSQPLPLHPMPSNPSDQTDVLEQLDLSYLILRGKASERSHPESQLPPPQVRAIRLCWLMHLIGDIHQPLHVATLVDRRMPWLQNGDEGGNKLAIRVNYTSAPRKLHAVWDDLLGTSAHFDHIVQLAERISHDPRFAESRLPEFASHKYSYEFAQESYQIAKEVVYQNGQIHFAPWSKVESHELDATDVPVLPQQLVERSRGLAERRVALAGYRLAERLKFIVSRSGIHTESAGNADSSHHPVAPSRRFVR